MGWGATLGEASGGLLGAAASIYATNKSVKSAKHNTQLSLDWERERAKNAHQWESEDLEAAGLNRALSVKNGSGAVTSGISPQMPDYSGLASSGKNFATVFDSLQNMKAVNSQIELNNSQKSLNEAKTDAENTKNGFLPSETKARIRNINAQTVQNNANAKLLESQDKLAQQGIGARILGLDPDKQAMGKAALLAAGSLLPGGILKTASSAKNAYNAFKTSRGFAKFLKTIK